MAPEEWREIKERAKKCRCNHCKEIVRVASFVDEWTTRARSALNADVGFTLEADGILRDIAAFWKPEGE